MKSDPAQTHSARARFVNLIHFHGLDLAVLNADGIDYIPAKPLCDLAGVNWRTARRRLESGDNVFLFGTTRLIPPRIEGLNAVFSVKTGGEPGLKASPLESMLCVRLDCSRMYVAQISTERMRANDNHAGADQVRALQKEWAQVLHTYETHGIAIKPGRKNALDELLKMTRLRNQLTDIHDRRHVDHIIHTQLHALGLPADTHDDDQLELPLPAPA